MVIVFYFPKKNKYFRLNVQKTLRCFEKPQRAVIMSWAVTELKKKKFDLSKLVFPQHLLRPSSLIGAAIDDLNHDQIMMHYQNP